RHNPDVLVEENSFDDEASELGARFVLVRVLLRAFDFRQANRGRSIRQREPNKDNASEGNRGGNKECQPPTNYNQIPAQDDNQAAADRMRNVPDGHPAGELLRWKPMR